MWKVSMFELQELVRLHRMGVSCHEVARLLDMSPNTERPYRLALSQAGLLEGSIEALPDEETLRRAVLAHRGTGQAPAQLSSVAAWLPSIEAWMAGGARPTAIHQRLTREDPSYTGSLSAVKRACLRIRRQRGVQPEDVAIPVLTAPGEIAQVDFGYVGKLLDPATMTMRKAWVFVMVLAHSRHLYCELSFDQKVETWLALHARAFAWFGGVPAVVVPDNLKAAVIRAAFAAGDTVAIHRSYRELARHFCFRVDPTPPYAPQKKGKVESAVKYVKRSFFDVYGGELDAVELQKRLHEWVLQTAGRRVHGTTHKRPLEVFESVERTALQPLPPVPFAPVVWRTVKVHTDTHVVFDRTLYSVPWRWIGAQGWVRAVGDSIQIYMDEVRVATHRRGKPGERVTVEEHLPEGRRDLRHRSRGYWMDRADRTGPETGAFVREVFASDDVLEQLRKVQAIVTHLESFPVHRAEAAAKRARFYVNYEYSVIKRILAEGLDRHPLPVTTPVRTTSGNARPRYARNVQHMLELHMENAHEPN